MNIVTGILSIVLAYIIFDTGIYFGYYGYPIDLGIFRIPLSIMFLIFGLYMIFKRKNNLFNKKEKYLICPKCKESFSILDLKDSICPTCNIITIDIDEYYKNK